jgi:hypothetical protein
MNAKVDREVTVLKKTWYRTKKKHFMIASSNIHAVDPEFGTRNSGEFLPKLRGAKEEDYHSTNFSGAKNNHHRSKAMYNSNLYESYADPSFSRKLNTSMYKDTRSNILQDSFDKNRSSHVVIRPKPYHEFSSKGTSGAHTNK